MSSLLEKAGFGPNWRKLFRTIYSDRTARLTINGQMSRQIEISRGVMQCDPISPSLFVLQSIPLCEIIEELQENHRLILPDGRRALSGTFYADDSTLIARSSAHAFELYDRVRQFCSGSGAKLHPGKCIAIAAGAAEATLPNGISILPPTESTTLLGIPIGTSISREHQIESIVLNMLIRCSEWQRIGRTLNGRITVARSIILATAWYRLSALMTSSKEAAKI